MEDFHFQCPLCEKRLAVAASGAGMSMACPSCGQSIRIPDTTSPSLNDPVIRECTPCPFCGEEILVTARKCKHCGEYLDESLRREKAMTGAPPSGPAPPMPPPPPRPRAETKLYEAHPAMFRNNPIGFILAVVFCLLGIGILILLVWWLQCLSTTLTITSKKTILRRGILSKYTNEVFHSDVRNVQVSQGLFQRMLGVGAVGISSAGQSGVEIAVRGIPDPARVRDLINKCRGK